MNLTQHDPPGYKARPLHYALLVSDLLARIHPLCLTPAWVALAQDLEGIYGGDFVAWDRAAKAVLDDLVAPQANGGAAG